MIDLTMEDLKQLLADGRRAAQYAWDHYEELTARKATYTLYGPHAYGTGAAIPGKFISKRDRNLTLKTRRKQYLVYELDHEYKLLRVRHVFDQIRDPLYECFELDGIQYACPFVVNRKKLERDEVLALSYQDGKPHYLGFLGENSIIAQFFEYVSQEKVLVSTYSYNPISEYTFHGYLTDPDAPPGALNSAANRACWEEEPRYTDFSEWFRKTEEGSPS